MSNATHRVRTIEAGVAEVTTGAGTPLGRVIKHTSDAPWLRGTWYAVTLQGERVTGAWGETRKEAAESLARKRHPSAFR